MTDFSGIAERVKEIQQRATRAIGIAADIKRMMNEQGDAEPVWWTDGKIKGIDMKLPFDAAAVDVAISALVRDIAAEGLTPVAVQHGLRVDVWTLQVKLV